MVKPVVTSVIRWHVSLVLVRICTLNSKVVLKAEFSQNSLVNHCSFFFFLKDKCENVSKFLLVCYVNYGVIFYFFYFCAFDTNEHRFIKVIGLFKLLSSVSLSTGGDSHLRSHDLVYYSMFLLF